jgi:putative SOS response-associated peptidase YedK
MCGRYALFSAQDELESYFEAIASNAGTILPNYNVTPGATMPVIVIGRDKVPVITTFRWGLIPAWADSPSVGYKMMNARSETIAEKPSFSGAFQRRRCLVPSNGFFEWQRAGKSKLPHFVRRNDDPIMTFAGVWDRWRPPNGPDIFSYSIITAPANDKIRDIHDRMPAVLEKADFSAWLSAETPPDTLKNLLKTFAADQTEAYPVEDLVNKPINNHPELLFRRRTDNLTSGTLPLFG